MPRKTLKKTSSKRTRKTAKPKKEVKEVVSTSVPQYKKPKLKHESYLGFSYETWINIILVVAIILIIGILAGVGVLVQKTSQTATIPKISPAQAEGEIGMAQAKMKAEKVLDIIAGPGNYNITNMYKQHGVYRIDLTVNTPTGIQKGSAFMSLDGEQMYFRYLDVDDFLQKYQNATLVGVATTQ